MIRRYLLTFLVLFSTMLFAAHGKCEDALDATIDYFAAKKEEAQAMVCKIQLEGIQYKKETWALDNAVSFDPNASWKDYDMEISMEELNSSGYPIQIPTCSVNGVYTIGKVNELPTCSIEAHNLDPRGFNHLIMPIKTTSNSGKKMSDKRIKATMMIEYTKRKQGN